MGVLDKFKEFRATVEVEVGRKICCLRSYNGREYTSKEFDKYLKKNRIRKSKSSAAERCSRAKESAPGWDVSKYAARKECTPPYWAECMMTAAYVINRLLQPRLGFLSLYSGECSVFRERFVRALIS